VNKCIDYLELLSAYVDGELTEYDRKRVEEHLETCENCSAILDLYREMSVASDEGCIPAPEALRAGVMEKVLSGETDSVDDAAKPKRQKIIRITLKRYIPVAACLAVMLLTLPWIINYRDGKTGESSYAPAAAPELLTVAPAQPKEAQDSISKPESGNIAAAGRGDMMPAMPQPEDDSANAEMGLNDNRVSDPASPLLPPSSPSPSHAPELLPEPAPDFALGSSVSDSPAVDADSETQLTESPGLASPDVSENWYGPSGFGDAYAWIEITGELPELIAAYDPEPLGDWPGGQALYRIPRTVAQELINDIRVRDGVEIPVNNIDGEYAVVLFTHNG